MNLLPTIFGKPTMTTPSTTPTSSATPMTTSNTPPVTTPITTPGVSLITQPNPNHNYWNIAKDFLERYLSTNQMGLGWLDNFYDSGAYISLCIHHTGQNYFFEMVGYHNLKNKFSELSVSSITYGNLIYLAQPLGKQNVIMMVHGPININQNICQMACTYLLEISGTTCKITNQMFEISTQ
jgi:hypothetical protein